MNRLFLKIFVGLLILNLFLPCVGSAQRMNGSFESKFKRYHRNEKFSGTETIIWEETAWKGERIYKQIVLWSNDDINNLEYEVSDLKEESKSILSTSITLKFGKYVKGDPEARSCSEYPTHPDYIEIIDALSSETINELQTSDPVKLWIVIDIPSSTEAGNYKGTFTVKGGTEPLDFSLNIEVVDYILPEVADWQFHLDLWQFPTNILNHYNEANSGNEITIWSDEHFELFEPAYKLLANTGQKAISAHIKSGALGAESMVKWIKKTDGIWAYDFSAFDKYVSALMSWGISKQINCFSPVGWNESTIPYWDESSNQTKNLNAPLGSESYNTRWNHFLTAFKIHLDNKAWFDKTVLYLDEVSEEKLNNVTSLVHGNNPDWKLGIAYSHSLPTQIKSKFYDLSGILESASNNGISENKISTFYTSCTQKIPNSYVTPENSAAEMTWMCWHALNQEYDGYLRWAFDYWRLNDPFDARDGAHTAGDFSLVYRNSNLNPIEYYPSLRLEMLREGIEDFEKVRILRDTLKIPSNPEDQEKLQLINSVIAKFGKTSGVNADKLILEAQNKLNYITDVSVGSFDFKKGNLRVYPNPLTGNKLTLHLPDFQNKKVGMTLLGSTGSIIFKTFFNNSNYMQEVLLPHNLSKGLYLLHIQTKDYTLSLKILNL